MRAVSPFTSVGDRGTNLPQVDFMAKPPLPSPAFDSLQPVPVFARQPAWHDAGIGSFQGTAAMPPIRSYQQPPSYPSPADSSFGSPHTIPSIFNMNGQSMQMPPPFPTSNPPTGSDTVRSPNGSNKRVKLSPREETFGRNPNRVYGDLSYGTADLEDPRSSFQPLTPSYFQPHLNNPLTPAASSTTSDDLHNKWMPKMSPKVTQATQENEVRRVSVNSLLSGSPEPEESRPNVTSQAQNESEQSLTFTVPQPPALLHHRTTSSSQTETYGLDRGLPDLDLPRNNDTGAISGASPSEHSELDAWLNDFELAIPEFGFGLPTRETVFAKGGYYASPVPIKIPRKLEPLPTTLLENPMNLLYFHHFLNHTARILVPHDCSENPFKTILPKSTFKSRHESFPTMLTKRQWPSRTLTSSIYSWPILRPIVLGFYLTRSPPIESRSGSGTYSLPFDMRSTTYRIRRSRTPTSQPQSCSPPLRSSHLPHSASLYHGKTTSAPLEASSNAEAAARNPSLAKILSHSSSLAGLHISTSLARCQAEETKNRFLEETTGEDRAPHCHCRPRSSKFTVQMTRLISQSTVSSALLPVASRSWPG
jgi:hypothetical protein